MSDHTKYVTVDDLSKLVEKQTDIIAHMSMSLEGATGRMTTSVEELRYDLKELRDTRFRPYITSMGLFVAVSLAVTGYVYGLENRTTQAFFKVSEEISKVTTTGEVNRNEISVNSERALARQEHALHRESIHSRTHENLEQRMRDLYESLLLVNTMCASGGEASEADG